MKSRFLYALSMLVVAFVTPLRAYASISLENVLYQADFSGNITYCSGTYAEQPTFLLEDAAYGYPKTAWYMSWGRYYSRKLVVGCAEKDETKHTLPASHKGILAALASAGYTNDDAELFVLECLTGAQGLLKAELTWSATLKSQSIQVFFLTNKGDGYQLIYRTTASGEGRLVSALPEPADLKTYAYVFKTGPDDNSSQSAARNITLGSLKLTGAPIESERLPAPTFSVDDKYMLFPGTPVIIYSPVIEGKAVTLHYSCDGGLSFAQSSAAEAEIAIETDTQLRAYCSAEGLEDSPIAGFNYEAYWSNGEYWEYDFGTDFPVNWAGGNIAKSNVALIPSEEDWTLILEQTSTTVKRFATGREGKNADKIIFEAGTYEIRCDARFAEVGDNTLSLEYTSQDAWTSTNTIFSIKAETTDWYTAVCELLITTEYTPLRFSFSLSKKPSKEADDFFVNIRSFSIVRKDESSETCLPATHSPKSEHPYAHLIATPRGLRVMIGDRKLDMMGRRVR